MARGTPYHRLNELIQKVAGHVSRIAATEDYSRVLSRRVRVEADRLEECLDEAAREFAEE